jgi:hypothetical protein
VRPVLQLLDQKVSGELGALLEIRILAGNTDRLDQEISAEGRKEVGGETFRREPFRVAGELFLV